MFSKKSQLRTNVAISPSSLSLVDSLQTPLNECLNFSSLTVNKQSNSVWHQDHILSNFCEKCFTRKFSGNLGSPWLSIMGLVTDDGYWLHDWHSIIFGFYLNLPWINLSMFKNGLDRDDYYNYILHTVWWLTDDCDNYWICFLSWSFCTIWNNFISNVGIESKIVSDIPSLSG